MEDTAQVAESLLGRNVKWGLDDAIWDLYGIGGQPVSVLIKDGVVVRQLFGASGEAVLTTRINELLDQ